jgi:hypothetical protein
MTEQTSESSNPPHHDIELNKINSMVVSVCTRSLRFRRKRSPKAHRNLVDAKVQPRFLGARAIEAG